ncbi:unnamed protein product [Rotaria magnacalcarata]|uniref:Uncharacterized protein n=1 Tax=Rotaria magnacalcarata TaxID=392030 RepID=A0A816UWQ4_9BILA|nr:unnamed protein product [Rotaria magnacalcarata]
MDEEDLCEFEDRLRNCCEFIISPEDMTECPLPDGYKPLLMPQLSHNSDSFVAYPYSAYLIGDNAQEFIYTPRNAPSTKIIFKLFDFKILTKSEKDSNNNSDILLFTLQTIEQLSISVPFNKINVWTKTVILFDSQRRHLSNHKFCII